jgi:hypothetical protein
MYCYYIFFDSVFLYPIAVSTLKNAGWIFIYRFVWMYILRSTITIKSKVSFPVTF